MNVYKMNVYKKSDTLRKRLPFETKEFKIFIRGAREEYLDGPM